MTRIRSPNYPAISLPEAIKLMASVQAAEQHMAAPKEVVAKHIGYTTYHGLAKRVISAREKYGLLEEVTGDKVKVSSLAMSILFPASPEEKQKAINEAAFKHQLFATIKEEWQGSRPSDENLRVYLIRRKFASDALDRVIEVYKETMDLVTPESGVYPAQDSGQTAKKQEAPVMQTHNLHAQPISAAPPPVLGSPRLGTTSVKIEDDRIEVAAVLLFQESIEDLITKLQAIKGLRPRATESISKKEEAAN
jgi:hypothetical protein